jgi:serine protease AprX
MSLKYFIAHFFIFCFSFAYAQRAWVDPALRKRPDNADNNIVVVLKQQADLTATKHIRGKAQKSRYVFNTLLNTADRSQVRIADLLKNQKISYQSFYIANAIGLKANKKLIDQLSQFEEIGSIIEDASYQMLHLQPDRTNGDRATEWGTSKIKAPQVWQLGHTGQGVVVGGQDTGYEWNHPAILNQYRGWNGVASNHNYNWHDAVKQNAPQTSGMNPCGYNLSVPCDDHNHGTHTAGTMVGDDGDTNQIGVAPSAKWIGCRNMERGWGTLTTYMECFEWFLAPYAYGDSPAEGDPDMAPHVINNSWYCSLEEGCNSSNFAVMETVINNLKNAGVVVVVSAGNSGSGGCSTVTGPPAFFENIFSVGATNSADTIAGFSSRGPVTIDGSGRLKPDVSAPGVSVRSCIRNGQYTSYSGTSMAGPHVAGAVALIISANPDLAGEVELIESILEQTAFHPSNTETCGSIPANTWPNNTFGYGRIDVLAAVTMAKQMHYLKRVKISDSDLIIPYVNGGILLKSQNQTFFKLEISNSGNLSLVSSPPITGQKTLIVESSLDLSQTNSALILQSSDGQYWQLTSDNNGNPLMQALVSLPTSYVLANQNNIIVENSRYGIMVKTPSGQCFIWYADNTGTLISYPIVCME